MSRTRALIAGNWKMNGLSGDAAEFEAMLSGLAARRDASGAPRADALICPPATLVFGFAERARSAQESGLPVAIGAQDCHAQAAGAHTGDLSAEMFADAGAAAVIVGHSERRAAHGEGDETVRAKASAAMRAGLAAVICLGESREEREAGRALDVILGQLAACTPDAPSGDARLETIGDALVVAYEPVWAIGTGLTPSLEDIREAHAALRRGLVSRFGEAGETIRLLYGGSVKPGNAADILSVDDVDGALVGGASLKAADFL
ncbi:MAG: triose-phosphate isomerase, partial [Pseudomonadota bacterium]